MQDPLNGLQELHIQAVCDVGPDGRPSRLGMRRLLHATRPGVDRFTHIELTDQLVRRRPRYVDLLGCVEGRTVSPGSGVHVTEMLLPRPLTLGETALVQHDSDLTDLPRACELTQHVLCPVHELLLWVHFDPAWVPSTWETRLDSPTATSRQPRDVLAGSTVHLALRDFGPGSASVCWSEEARS